MYTLLESAWLEEWFVVVFWEARGPLFIFLFLAYFLRLFLARHVSLSGSIWFQRRVNIIMYLCDRDKIEAMWYIM